MTHADYVAGFSIYINPARRRPWATTRVNRSPYRVSGADPDRKSRPRPYILTRAELNERWSPEPFEYISVRQFRGGLT